MNYENERIINCFEFEENLTDYLDKTLDGQTRKAVAAHALRCPICHSLLNEVKNALEVCHEIAVPKSPMTRLEARILSMTMPEMTMACRDFEHHLTDYLDGFLPAVVFHRWERHAFICEGCTDLPGEVVRTIGALYTYKADEMPLPAGLHSRILQATSGSQKFQTAKVSWTKQFGEWAGGFKFPISIPQLAPVAMMLILAFFVFSETVSADGSITGMYQKSYELAEQTYKQSTGIWNEDLIQPASEQKPIEATPVSEDK